jgi:hypothetical protein
LPGPAKANNVSIVCAGIIHLIEWFYENRRF